MANGIMNIARGRIQHYGRLPEASDAFILVLLQNAEADDVLEDHDTLSALLAASGNTEATFTGSSYGRKTISTVTVTVNDSTDIVTVDIADQVFTAAGGTIANTIVKTLICYDNDTGVVGDVNIVPLLHYDTVFTTDGNDVTLQFHPNGIWQSGT